MKNTEDQLSSLSDDILIKILSLLPIKTAVATSVLSRRWINLWTHITAFRLHEPPVSVIIDDESGTTHYTSNLTSIVDNLLPKLNSPVISTFTLHLDSNTHTNPDSIDSWIRFICARNVQYFKLSYWSDDSFLSLSTSCLFRCRSLVSLSLHVKCLSDEESLSFEKIEINLPDLKILDIGSLHDCHETLMAKLFKSFPRLEELRILGFLCHPGQEFDPYGTREVPVFISGQYLRSLSIDFNYYEDYDNVVVYVDAPNLQIFKVDDISYLQFRFISKPRGLVKAKFKHAEYDTFSKDNMEWFEAISGVSNLKIGESILQNVFLIEDYQLPIFSNLTKLVTSVSTICGWKTDFFRLLECTPNLEFLDINLLFSSCIIINEADDPTNLFPQALSAPSCLVHRVKKMEFQIHGMLDCQYQELELEVVKYMLIHARALEELVIKVRCIAKQKDELLLHEELELYHLYENLHDLPRSLGVHCSVTLKFVLYYGVFRLVFPHQMEYEDARANNSSPSLNPKDYYSAPRITFKESFLT